MSKILIIAEAGVNHNGSIALAKQLIDVAADAGADFVKFQTFKADKLVTKSAQKAAYQVANTGNIESQFEMLKRLEISHERHTELSEYCQQKGIAFLSTPFDFESIDLLKSMGITLGKIPSGELTNLPFLRKMAQTFPNVILSTGMSDMAEVRASVEALKAAGTKPKNLAVLHCNTEYPTPYADVNLRAMLRIGEELGVQIGYSDHTLGIEVPIAAVALGATVIEKHFTLDRTLEGPDHRASLEPQELKAMIQGIRNVELALAGTGQKQASASEIKNKEIARKSITAARNISVGEVFTEENLSVKRPGSGLSPMLWDSVLGQKAKRDFREDDLIEL